MTDTNSVEFAPVKAIIRNAIKEAYDLDDAVNLVAENMIAIGATSIPAYEDVELLVLDELAQLQTEMESGGGPIH